MIQFDKNTIGRQAKELGFVRDTFEKVCRLADVLKFFENDDILSRCLALKGGTAINLTIFNLPRLSVDIDLDFSENISRDEMLEKRPIITERISKYMSANGYVLSGKSKQHHALDSFVFEYQNSGGMKENIKIEINYMIRCHILPVTRRKVNLPWLSEELTVLSVAPMEIFASKIVALLNRTAPRDLYDIHNLLELELFDESEQDMLKKCVVFYSCIGSETVHKEFTFESLDKMPQNKIKTDLLPVLRFGAYFDLKPAREKVTDYLKEILVLTPQEKEFIECFDKGEYKPELIFEGYMLNNVSTHPMAIWKCNKTKENLS
ncbi:MAG: nucleotidyl transferase AbiEii/AbiGii toxin family protein [Clostridia bacterium]|nr:nucleotidyl transferase AbiEii/AbiGii toxin family protein [Clostridia bacterium]